MQFTGPRVWTLLLLAGLPCIADDASILNQLKNNLPKIKNAATDLGSMAPTVLGITIAIGVLGVVVTTLVAAIERAKPGKAWLPWVGSGTGLLISVLTVVNTTYFVLDHKTLKFLAQDALHTVEVMENNITSYAMALTFENAAQRERETDKYLQDVAEGQKLLGRLEEQSREGGHSLGVNRSIPFIRSVTSAVRPGREAKLWLAPEVHAADKAPAWLAKPPFDRHRTGYVGVAACSTPYGAREMARYQAMENAARRLEQGGMDLDAKVSFVERNAQEAGNYFFYEAYSRMYWHHTLLFLDNEKVKAIRAWQAPEPSGPPRWVGRFAGRDQGNLVVGAPGGASRNQNEGSFKFHFNRGDVLSLRRIDVFDDSSASSTRWIFKVFYNNKQVIHIPVHRYEDSGKPTSCLVRPEDRRTAPVGGSGNFELRVEGYKPKDYK